MSQPEATAEVPPPTSQQIMVASPPASQATAYVYQPEPPRKQPRIWRAIKWPLRQAIKGVYLPSAAVRRHKVAALLTLLALALVAAGAYGVYRATHPDSASGQLTASAGEPAQPAQPAQPDTPFTITSAAQPAIPSAVIRALHGYKTNDAHEFFSSMSPQFQAVLTSNGRGEAQLKAAFDQRKQAGITFQQFIYTGGFVAPDGGGYYTFTVVLAQGGQLAEAPLYFAVDQTGLISNFAALALSSQG